MQNRARYALAHPSAHGFKRNKHQNLRGAQACRSALAATIDGRHLPAELVLILCRRRKASAHLVLVVLDRLETCGEVLVLQRPCRCCHRRKIATASGVNEGLAVAARSIRVPNNDGVGANLRSHAILVRWEAAVPKLRDAPEVAACFFGVFCRLFRGDLERSILLLGQNGLKQLGRSTTAEANRRCGTTYERGEESPARGLWPCSGA